MYKRIKLEGHARRGEYTTPHGVVREQVQAAFPAEKLALLRHGLSLDGQALRPAHTRGAGT